GPPSEEARQTDPKRRAEPSWCRRAGHALTAASGGGSTRPFARRCAMTLRLSVPTGVLLAVSAAAVAVAGSAAPDHLQCYAVRDPLQLRALVDLTSPQYGLAKGCRVRRGRELCVPASKAVTSA